MQIRLHNTLSRSIQEFHPADGSRTVRMYSCGPTVYNVAHIGNMRAFLVADLVQRTLRVVGGYDVRWVMNITDIDDKTIADSAIGSPRWRDEMGPQSANATQNLHALTTFYTAQFFEDLRSLGVNLAHMLAQPRATDFIPQMQQLIREIYQAGYAYERDGSVYFNVTTYAKAYAYGRLFTIDRENFKEGARIDADEYDRESVSDFVLWKARKDGEPSWDFQWTDERGTQTLPGRPGWHLECSAMSRELLGPLPFDVHTGGVDLRFPHHEDELAQCCAAHGPHTNNTVSFTEQSNFWLHNEFLEVEGQKMSKSLGNFFTLRDLIHRGHDPLDIRLAMLGAHYRSVYNFTIDGLKGASAARKRVQEYIWELWDITRGNGYKEQDVASGPLRGVFEALADDVHTPRALAELYTVVGNKPARELTQQEATALLAGMHAANEVLSVWQVGPRPVIEVPDHVRQLADDRWQARESKNWPESDRLRAVLTEAGWTVKDGKHGYELFPTDS